LITNTERGRNASINILNESLIHFGSTLPAALHRTRWELKRDSGLATDAGCSSNDLAVPGCCFPLAFSKKQHLLVPVSESHMHLSPYSQ